MVSRSLEKGRTTRAQIVAGAERLFTAAGYDGTSVEAILETCGISRGALYHHFPSKERLFEAVFEAVEAEATAGALAAAAGLEPGQALRASFAALLDLARSERIRRIVLTDAPAVLGWARWREIEGRYGLAALKAGLNAAAAARGRAEAIDDAAAHLLLAALIEASLLVARSPADEGAIKTCADILDRLTEGLLA